MPEPYKEQPTSASDRFTPIQFTSEQQALLDWAVAPAVPGHPRHAILEARAGSGKTTTLLSMAERIMHSDPRATILVVAFNKRIAEEITAKARALGLRPPRLAIRTLHACGNEARMSLSEFRRSALNRNKVADLIGLRISALRRSAFGGNLATRPILGAKPLAPAVDPGFLEKHRTVIEQLVDFGRLYGVGVSFMLEDLPHWETIIQRHITLPRAYTAMAGSRVTLVESLLSHACELIKESEAIAPHEHDFVDMLWLPILCGAAFRQYDWVLVDEAQDTNSLSRAISLASLRESGRMVLVGDPHQCINGFQGADDSGIDVMQQHLGAATFPLTISQRCATAITAHARGQTACKDIRSRDNAPAGQVRRVPLSALFPEGSAAPGPEDFTVSGPGDKAVLCRNNAPLLSFGFSLMSASIPFHISGGADLYARLSRLASRWKARDANTLLFRLAVFRESEISRLRALSAAPQRIDAICDEIDMLVTVIGDFCSKADDPDGVTQADILRHIETLKAEQESNNNKGIVLSTIHKAKGLEWDTVYLLGADTLMPSRYANTAFDYSQEDHIRYVAITRAINTLVYIDCSRNESSPPDQDPFNGRDADEFLGRAIHP